MFSRASVVALVSLAVLSAAIPTQNGGGGSSTTSECNDSGYNLCCDSVNTAGSYENQGFWDNYPYNIHPNTMVGTGCSSNGGDCNTQQVCCDGVSEGLGLSCNNIDVSL